MVSEYQIYFLIEWAIKGGGSVFYFEFVCTHFRNVRILFHDRTVLSQQANNISSSFSKCSLCQKVLRFTRTAHKGGFTSIKKLKRRLLEPCPSSSIPPALCKGRARYIFLPFYFFLPFSPFSSLSFPRWTRACLVSPTLWRTCKSLIYRIPSLPPYTPRIHTFRISFPRRLHLHLRASLPFPSALFSFERAPPSQASTLVLFPFPFFHPLPGFISRI